MQQEVIVYSKDMCGQCQGVKMFLNMKGIKFDERNIDHNETYREEAKATGLMGMPITIVKEDGADVVEPFAGFQPDILHEIFGHIGE